MKKTFLIKEKKKTLVHVDKVVVKVAFCVLLVGELIDRIFWRVEPVILFYYYYFLILYIYI